MPIFAKLLRRAALLVGLAVSIGALRGAGNSPGPGPASPDRYIAAVRTFADNVLALGTDHYGPTPTPLFVDGVDVDTHEPVKWKSRDGHEWVLSDFANQQNLLRTLDGLTALTGEPRYRAAGAAATRYAFDHLDRGGLLAWGGHMAYNASDARIESAENKGAMHELKSHYPYYEFLWQVDPVKTKTLMENIWRGHILDWANLDFNRHAAKVKPGPLWDSEYTGGPVFFWGHGLTFHNAGSDLYYDAAILSRLSGEAGPLVWAKRLAHRTSRRVTQRPASAVTSSARTRRRCATSSTIRKSVATAPSISLPPIFRGTSWSKARSSQTTATRPKPPNASVR